MTFATIFQGFTDSDMMIPIMFSILTGALIGGERELQGKDAGLRTHMLVCFASCLLTLLGLRMAEWVVFLPADAQIVSDMSRMPHAVITGVGFLGAGVIFRNGSSVQGLTTAASLWLTAALGVTFGTDMIELGIVGLVCAIGVLLAMRLVQPILSRSKTLRIEVSGRDQAAPRYDDLDAVLRRLGVKVISVGMASQDAGRKQRILLLVSANTRSDAWQGMISALAQVEGVQDIAVVPTDIDWHPQV